MVAGEVPLIVQLPEFHELSHRTGDLKRVSIDAVNISQRCVCRISVEAEGTSYLHPGRYVIRWDGGYDSLSFPLLDGVQDAPGQRRRIRQPRGKT